ncbi:Pabp1-dependent poly A-specific ribonuclease [Cryptosporidium ubiquitum]|uniref:Pabp1-dependent poly A-specific ribonuclease n=1 Tax=Cryptosporidium ubiquitum TaxID=857276 RepID=A0A1J4MCI4_9CRYT|nr:Pabp1-dependent poly A-specific ribonuclease [Cryptosporidium ubiquitum]OII71926.1 Pabp1-dependent poly A-specific ribonuclease [Cryptosporidium ubiquitum]
MKEKTPAEAKRGDIETKSHSGLVSSFHADAPTFQPRSGFVVGMGAGAGTGTVTGVASSSGGDVGSGLTASAQPFIPSAIRHNTSTTIDHGEHGGFQMSSVGYSNSHIGNQSASGSKQNMVFTGSGSLLGGTPPQDSVGFGGMDLSGNASVSDGTMGVVGGISGSEYEGLLIGGTTSGQKSSSSLQEESQSSLGGSIHGIQYNSGTGSGTGSSGTSGFQSHNMNGLDSTNYYGDSGNHTVGHNQSITTASGAGTVSGGAVGGLGLGVGVGVGGSGSSAGMNQHHHSHPNILDLSEYCRRVRGWNLPFLRTIPQMNAITQIRHELQLQNISLLLTQNDIISANQVHSGSSGEGGGDGGSGNGSGGIGQHYVPPIVQRIFYGLCLLDDSNVPSTTRFCGYQTYAYKAINVEDYSAYCLRRIDGFPLSEFDTLRPLLERWQKLAQHPCIVSYRQSFASLDFSQGSLVAVYDYIPNASTMESVHFKEPIGEPLLWNYIIQIVLALVHIHSSQLAARVIDPTKLLISYRGRLRLNCVGILDLTRVDESKTILDYQKQDLVALGYIILALCCGSLTIINDLNHAVEQIFLKSSLYSNDLKKLVLILLSKPALNKNNLDVFILANMLAARMIPQIEHSLKLTDALENEFRKEIDNGRLFRLLTKINTIADRTQLNAIHKWNETGDRYICKLFREYLFQQTDSQGRPVIDMGHILDSLAKVDVGTSETITLMSSDGSSILLVSFADIKHSIEKSFCEIIAATTSSSNFHDL